MATSNFQYDALPEDSIRLLKVNGLNSDGHLCLWYVHSDSEPFMKLMNEVNKHGFTGWCECEDAIDEFLGRGEG